MDYKNLTPNEFELMEKVRYNAMRAGNQVRWLKVNMMQIFNARPNEWHRSSEGQKFAVIIDTLRDMEPRLKVVAVMLREDKDTE